jgi:hypothetical protein
VGGQPVAFVLGIQSGGVLALPKGGQDPAFRSYGAGLMLIRGLLRRCFDDPSVTRFHFLGEAEEYKRVFTNSEEPQMRLAILRDDPAGRARRAGVTAGWRARDEVVRRLPLELRTRLDFSGPAGVARSTTAFARCLLHSR